MSAYKFKYSIIIPHYNDIDSLAMLINSIPKREDIQIIIVDDNTFPGTDRVESSIQDIDREIMLLFNDDNKRGAGACRNVGIDHAEGEWLIFSDADDYFMPRAFEAFDKGSTLNTDIVYYKMTSINLPSKGTGRRHLQYCRLVDAFLKKRNRNNELNLRYNYPSPCAKMIRHDLVTMNHIKFDEIRWSNDDLFATKCGYFARAIDAIDDTVYCAIRKDGTITTTKSEAAIKTKLDVYIRKTLFLKEKLKKEDFRRVTRWPGNKMIIAKLEGYDKSIIQYIKNEYAIYNISLLWINRSDIDEAWIKIRSYLLDRKYS